TPRSILCFPLPALAPTQIYTLSLHDALPISDAANESRARGAAYAREHGGTNSRRLTETSERFANRQRQQQGSAWSSRAQESTARSEEHTSELQSLAYLVCRLLLEKKKKAGSC